MAYKNDKNISVSEKITNDKLSLPYDRLPSRNREADFRHFSHSLSQKKFKLIDFVSPNELTFFQSNLSALVCTLFYRYSNQSHLPLIQTQYDASACSWIKRELLFEINGQTFFNDIKSINDVETPNISPVNSHSQITHNQDFLIAIVPSTISPKDFSDYRTQLELQGEDYSLLLLIVLEQEQFSFHWYYDNCLFDDISIENLGQNLVNLIQFNSPETTVAELSLLDKKQQDWLKTVGDGGSHQARFLSIVSGFDRQVQLNPDAIAIEYNATQLSYRQLEQKSNQLANLLIKMDVQTESKVAVFIDPSLDILITLLAIFKCSATYVPLDPGFPDGRIKTILDDVTPTLIVTQNKWLERLENYSLELVTLDELDNEMLALASSKPPVEYSPNATASIFYTSGTTGKPKGVMASYANINHYLSVAQERYRYHAQDIIPAVARFTFSISLFELLSPVLAGGKLLIIDRDDILDLPKMLSILTKVSAFHIGPSLLKALVNQIKQSSNLDFSQLRHVSSGGDMIPAELLNDLQLQFPQAELHVIYGCSEISCMGVTHFIPTQQQIHKTLLGKPFPNVKVRLLDDDLNLLPQGAVGNVCFAGAGLVKGYFNNPSLTQEKFFDFQGERYYYTGDRGKLSVSGDLELLGRRDFQIQLRGIRIELGEIEYTLRQIEGVKDGVIAQKQNANGELVLVAFIVLLNENILSHENALPNKTELTTSGNSQTDFIRNQLALQLPDYMLPHLYVVLDKLPLNHNLKVDRSALVIPAAPDISNCGEVYANTQIQHEITQIWQPLLAISSIDINTHFFALGGDSIGLAKAVTLLKKQYGNTIGLAKLFEQASIAQWEKLICEAQANNNKSSTSAQTNQLMIAPCQLTDYQATDSSYLLPATYTQSQFWYLYQLDPNDKANNIPFVFNVKGKLNIKNYQLALNILIERHAILRTSFVENETGIYQQLVNSLSIKIPVKRVEATNFDDANLVNTLNQRAFAPFDLTQGPLFRVECFQLTDERFCLLICFHHIIIDQTSIVQFGQELDQVYQSLQDQQKPQWVAPQLSFADYAVWQKNNQSARQLTTQISFWQQQLNGISHYLDFPLDNPRSGSTAGSDISFSFTAQLSHKIEAFAQQNSISVYMVLLAGYSTILNRYTQQTDVIVGTPFANRGEQLELQQVLGCFINTLPIVIHFDAKNSFLDILENIRNSVYQVSENQAVPIELIIDALNPERTQHCNPIYQVGLTYQDAPLQLHIENCELQSVELINQGAQLDFITHLWKDNDCIQGVTTFNSSILTSHTIQQFIQHFEALLTSAIESPRKNYHALNIYSDTQKCLLTNWNDTSIQQESEKQLLLSKFEQQVNLTPNAVAIEFSQHQLSYTQLNARAEKLAHYLIQQDLKEHALVGILCNRSLEMIIAIYATLKAGAAYVPIDPLNPVDRVNYILAEANINLVLTHQSVAENVKMSATQISIDQHWQSIENAPKVELPVNQPDDLAYVIYTSGSTGNPKGVMITHAAALNSFMWLQQNFNLDEQDVILLKTAFTFDVSVWELFWPLMHGAKMIIADVDGHKDTQYLKSVIKSKKISYLNFVPSMLRVFLEEENLLDCPNLRYVVSGGEQLNCNLIEQFYQRSNAQLYNTYGPTEASIFITLWPCNKSDQSEIVPIGLPMPNCQFYVFDQSGTRQPVGAIGELYIAGKQLAQGYVNQIELTQDKFVSKNIDGNIIRMYRTGDLVKQLHNGAYHYLGRTDFQIKLRGLRIELGEIEKVILLHPKVTQVHVIAQGANEQEKQLVAYFVSTATNISLNELQQLVVKKLPQYMVPTQFIQLEKIPLNSSGKFDRKQLPEFTTSVQTNKVKLIQPQNSLQRQITEVWQQLLKHENFGIHHNFFNIGGHSLLATQMRSRINKLLAVQLPLVIFINNPSIAQLAENVAQSTQSSIAHEPEMSLSEYVANHPRPQTSQLSFAQQRLWYLDQLDQANPVYNIPQAYRLQGALESELLSQAISGVFARHESLRTRLKTVHTQAIQVIQERQPIYLKQIDISHEQNISEKLATLLLKEMRKGFNLAEDTLIRFVLIKEAAQSHVLFIMAHHTIFDGWSTEILMRELRTDYQALLLNHPIDSQPGDYQYTHYSDWQRSWLSGPALEIQLNYWKTQLSGQLPILELPFDFSRKKQFTFKGKKFQLNLGEKLLTELNELAQQHNVTLFMLILSYYVVFLYRHSNQTDIIIGTPIANRHYADTENIIGYFANTLAIRAKFETSDTFTELLAKIKQTCVDGYVHQDMPFEQLVKAIHPERSISHTPIYQTLFLFADESNQNLAFGDLKAEKLPLDPQVAHTDLSFEVNIVGKELYLAIEYCTDLFAESSIQLFAERFQCLLAQAPQESQYNINQLSVIANSEIELMQTWNTTQSAVDSSLNVDQLLTRQSKLNPDKIAIIDQNSQLTFAQLEAQVNNLAGYLQQNYSLQPGELIGLSVNRSHKMLVCMLAILRAGCAYLPLDPSYPSERINYILNDAKSQLLITEEDSSQAILGYNGKILSLSSIDFNKKTLPVETIIPAGSRAAYAIYTSGSTGKPKGVLISHQNVVNFLTSMAKSPGMNQQDKCLAITTISFDIAVLELFLPLMVGAQIILSDKQTSSDSRLLAQLIEQHSVTFMQATPATWNMLQSTSWQPKTPLKVLCGGEAMHTELARYLLSISTQVWNMYGPTETTVWSSIKQIKLANEASLIGKPIDNTQLFILNSQNALQPLGVAGELYIAGDGLSSGYLQRAEMTSQKFFEVRLNGGQPIKVYRTGDRVRLKVNGDIEYIERTDNQVKLRGFRIELGEIENTILSHTEVIDVACVIKQGQQNDARLCAYYLSKDDAELNGSELKNLLNQYLPAYMIPQHFIKLNSLPKTPNGKVDRKALPELDYQQINQSLQFEQLNSEDQMAATLTPIQLIIANIWRESLLVDEVALYDNFFDLGGHSLLSIQVIEQIKKQLGIEISAQDILMNNLAQIASQCENLPSVKSTSRTPFIKRIKHWFVGS